MSRQAALNFILKANEDQALYEKVNSLPSSRVESLLDIAREAGFDFTADEFVSTILEQVQKSGELREDDLERVAAGAAVDYFSQPASALPVDQFSLNFLKFAQGSHIKKFGDG